jgi:uncharacterized membrane protein
VKSLLRIRQQITLHVLFRIAILFKGVDGLLETVGGTILLFVSREDVRQFVYGILQHELLEDPNDPIASRIVKAAARLTASTKTFAAAYLLVHGVVKLGLATAIWRHRLWAYPVAGTILALFVVYQLGRFAFTHSIMLLLLTAVDIFVIALLPREYKHLSNTKEVVR